MCGIAGVVYPTEGSEAAVGRATAMQLALVHRGPDSRDLWAGEDCVLAHTRLAIIDLEHGQQPMTDASGRYVVVFNGEIYNHLELRAEIGDRYPFGTTSDTETLLAAYTVWGDACVDRLNGMFAFFVWDRMARTGFAARDALGVKPFVYSARGGELVFASEAKAILAQARQRPALDMEALVEGFVVPGFSGVRTSMFEGIEHLPAGHQLHVTPDSLTVSAWFRHDLAPDTDLSAADVDALAGQLRDAFEAGVSRSLLADVPLGVFLSGGLDSTAITWVASRRATDPLKAFSIRFEDHANVDFGGSRIVVGDDDPYAAEVARLLSIDLEPVEVRQQEVVPLLDRLARVDDRLLVWEQEYVQYALAGATVRDRKVALVGDTADEQHFGYFWFLDDAINESPRALIELFGADLRAGCLSKEVQAAFRPLERLPAAYEELAAEAGYRFGSRAERIQATSYLVLTLWLGRLLHNGDIMTMAHGLEARVPFSDRELMRIAETVPPGVGFAAGEEKALLRRAVRRFVPDSVFNRRKSALPRDPRMGPLYQEALRRTLDEDEGFAKSFFDVAELSRLCEVPAPTDIERMVLFSALALLHWQRIYGAAPG